MSAITESLDHGHDPGLHHQFEDMGQQSETYIVGMWTFLVSEVMFFGALFLVYTLYRWNYQLDFYIAHEHLDVRLGAINTTVLLFSSFTMVMAVQSAQLKERLIWRLGEAKRWKYKTFVINGFIVRIKLKVSIDVKCQ